MIKQRNFWTFFLLNLVTCGIYSIVFWYNYSDDTNRVCYGDGKVTQNYIIVFLLSIVTCGIYYWFWIYQVANRLQENAPRYGTNITENGTTVLLWMLLGSFLCFVGSYYAIYLMIKNMNQLAYGYNQQNYGGNGYQQNYQQPPYNN